MGVSVESGVGDTAGVEAACGVAEGANLKVGIGVSWEEDVGVDWLATLVGVGRSVGSGVPSVETPVGAAVGAGVDRGVTSVGWGVTVGVGVAAGGCVTGEVGMGCFVPAAPGVGVGEVVAVGVGLPSEVRVGVGAAVGESPAQPKETAISNEMPDTRRGDLHRRKIWDGLYIIIR